MGPHEFPLSSDKYNPRPRPISKSLDIVNLVMFSAHDRAYWIANSGALSTCVKCFPIHIHSQL